MNRMIVDLQEYVNEIEKRYGNRDAYRYIVGNTVVSKTFKEFKKDIYAVASWFVKRGWQGKHVAIIGSSSYQWVTTFLGVECSANVVIPIDKMLSEEEMLNLLVMGDVDVVFLSEEFEPMMKKIQETNDRVIEVISFSGTRFREMLRTEHTELPTIDPNALAEILFTSGTTGVSKGVMLTQKNITSNINDIYRMDFAQNVKKDPVVMSVLPIHHTFELTVDNLGVLYCGATVCINDKIENIVANLNLFKPSVILVVPTIAEVFYKKVMDGLATNSNKHVIALAKKINRLFRLFKLDISRWLFRKLLAKFGGNLTNVIVGGAALRPEIAEAFDEFGINMYQGYGLTECAPLISANYPKKNKFGSVGQPVSYIDVKIENGEILVKGSGVMLGYYKNPEATAEAFTSDGFLRTGDLGYFDHEGYLYITGRSKNLIILANGKNIYPEELETHIAVIDGIKDVLVYEKSGKICAAIQPTDINDNELTANIKREIKNLNATLPSYKKIVDINFIAKDFPKTTTLKIKRSEAIKMLDETINNKVVTYVPPTTEEQKKIVSVFENVLDKKKVGILDNFFDMGGGSLLAFEAAALIGVQAQEIYDNPTAEQLERVLLAIKTDDEAERTNINVNELIKHNSSLLHTNEAKYVLLTGATGYLGSHILRELLRRQMNVVCLVRDKEKLKNTLKYYFPKEHEYFRYRVRIGDISEPKLGLSDEEYDQLLKKVDMVIHTAANVNHTGRYEEFERTNVLGTQ
ncbi:MAG: AMP-binding protein, partial [Clostridia bacterium]|nr:AMP-binding protein [Clostridia bacterium]